MKTNTLHYLAYDRALSLKYQLGAVHKLLLMASEDQDDTDKDVILYGAAKLTLAIQGQAQDLMLALDSTEDIIHIEIESTVHPADQVQPNLGDIAALLKQIKKHCDYRKAPHAEEKANQE
jgi:hypothetical protein